VVALIALQNMTAEHASATNALLTKFPNTVKPFCGETGLAPAAQDSTWADDFRKQAPQTGRWHYIDLPFTGTPDLPALCQSGCVIQAIKEQIAVFQANPGTAKAADALRFIIHLVGDVHQPLHGISNNDHGGNCIPVRFLKQKPWRRTDSKGNVFYSIELHLVWDVNVVDKDLGENDISKYAGRLSTEAAPHRSEWTSFSISDDMEKVALGWARESHDTAVAVSYANLDAGSPPGPIDASAIAGPPDLTSCGAFQDRVADMKVRLNGHYVHVAIPAAEQRMEQAGMRLAAVLDQLWNKAPRP
jgi:hypothetical protein